MCLGISVNREKVGNLMVYLADRLKPLYHTKLIKLLYLIDEAAVKDRGIPITWLDYKVWQHGPVAPETYYIKCGGETFKDFVSAKKVDNGFVIEPVTSFYDGDFSEYDFDIIDGVIAEYGNWKPSDLVTLTHQPDSLWNKTKKEYNIDFSEYNISDYSLDFKKLINDEIKLDNYEGARDVMLFNSMCYKASC